MILTRVKSPPTFEYRPTSYLALFQQIPRRHGSDLAKDLALGEVLILSFTSAFPHNPSKFHSGPFRHPVFSAHAELLQLIMLPFTDTVGGLTGEDVQNHQPAGQPKAAQPCTAQQMAWRSRRPNCVSTEELSLKSIWNKRKELELTDSHPRRIRLAKRTVLRYGPHIGDVKCAI